MKAVVGNRYKHYKGKEYVVLHIANHSETLEELIIYEAQYNSKDFGHNAIWARPRKMFEEKIEIDSKFVHRFKTIDKVD